MLNKKEKRVIIALDIVEVLLLLTALIIFTIVFRIVEEPIRYLFLAGDLCIIYSFNKALNSLGELITKKEKKQTVSGITEVSI